MLLKHKLNNLQIHTVRITTYVQKHQRNQRNSFISHIILHSYFLQCKLLHITYKTNKGQWCEAHFVSGTIEYTEIKNVIHTETYKVVLT